MFHEQYERQDSLFKSHQKSILSIISSNTKITTQQLDRFNEKIEENANRIKKLEKQNHDFSESLNTCQSIHDDKVTQAEKKTEKLHKQVKSVKKDI